MFIYRIEDDSKIGPYNSENRRSRDIISMHGNHKQPTPYADKFEKDYQYYNSVCAFKSKKQLLSWFTKKQLQGLFECGFYLLVTMVDRKEVIAGKRQILINRKHLSSRRQKGIKIRSVQEL